MGGCRLPVLDSLCSATSSKWRIAPDPDGRWPLKQSAFDLAVVLIGQVQSENQVKQSPVFLATSKSWHCVCIELGQSGFGSSNPTINPPLDRTKEAVSQIVTFRRNGGIDSNQTIPPQTSGKSRWKQFLTGAQTQEFSARMPSRGWVLALAIACLIAIGVSGYLGWVALTSSKVAGCGGGRLFNCGHVISSRWSLWMGIPVSLLACGLYIAMAVSLFVAASQRFGNAARHIAWALVSLLATCAGLAAIWFISLQIFVLNHLCTYCLAAHTCGLVTAAIVCWRQPVGLRELGRISLLAFAGISILIVGQLMTAAPKTYKIEQFNEPAATGEAFEFEAPLFEAPALVPEVAPSKPTAAIEFPSSSKQFITALLQPSILISANVNSGQPVSATEQGIANGVRRAGELEQSETPSTAERRFVEIIGGTVKLDVSQWPVAGPKTAKYIFVEMFDYSCPHCRNTHDAIKAAGARLDGDLAVVVLPIPLSAACNPTIQVTDPKFVESCEIAKLAVAVWRVDPVRFTEFHNWMFEEAKAPNFAAAKAQAQTLVDVTKLNAELASAVPAQYIAKTVELYKRAGSGNVPKLIFPTTSIVGEFTSGDSLVEIIKQQIR